MAGGRRAGVLQAGDTFSSFFSCLETAVFCTLQVAGGLIFNWVNFIYVIDWYETSDCVANYC